MATSFDGRRIVTFISTILLTVLIAVVVGGCTSGRETADSAEPSDPESSSSSDSSESGSSESAATQTPAPAGGQLTIDRFHEGVYCDDSERPAIMLLDASPGETITFTSPMPVQVPNGVADDRGTYQLTWKCEEVEASLSWQLTATGTTSGRTATFFVYGSYEDPDGARLMTFTPSPDPLVCDGRRQIVGQLDNAAPYEIVDFVSPNADGLRAGTADALGAVEVGWTCGITLSETNWEVRVTGESSKRTAAFTITGLPPQPLDDGPIVVELTEDPFVCNRDRRRVATLFNLTPDVEVRFVSSPAAGAENTAGESMRAGQADRFGVLDLYWQCHRNEAATTWDLTAAENNPFSTDAETRSTTFAITGASSGVSAAIEVTEDPFACDGSSHEYAVLSNFVSREFVDFSSPQSTGIRQGQADRNGDLPIRWQCDPDEAGSRWDVTATGVTSGLQLTFTISGSAP